MTRSACLRTGLAGSSYGRPGTCQSLRASHVAQEKSEKDKEKRRKGERSSSALSPSALTLHTQRRRCEGEGEGEVAVGAGQGGYVRGRPRLHPGTRHTQLRWPKGTWFLCSAALHCNAPCRATALLPPFAPPGTAHSMSVPVPCRAVCYPTPADSPAPTTTASSPQTRPPPSCAVL